jgi:hypothetical protein
MHGYGSGRVVYFAGTPGRVYYRRGYVHIRKMLANAVSWAAGQPAPVEMDAGMGLKLTAFRQPDAGRLIVHVINLQVSPAHDVKRFPAERPGGVNWANPVEEIVPARRVNVRVAASSEPKRVYLAPESVDLAYAFDGAWIRTTIPEVAYHSMLVVEGEVGGCRR